MAAEWCLAGVRLKTCGHAMFEGQLEYVNNQLCCPVCGIVVKETDQLRDGVPDVEQGRGCGYYSSRLHFSDGGEADEIPSSLEGLLATISSGLQNLKLDATVGLELGREVLEQGFRRNLVLRAWPTGCTVTGGTIFLPYSSVLLLTGAGVRFQDTVFLGSGLIVCCGDSFSASFEGCRIKGGTLYAVHGATVRLDRCRLTTSPFGLVAHGHATCATVYSCSFESCQTAVVAEHGATVVMHQCSSFVDRTMVVARDPSTRVTCMDCQLHACPHLPSICWQEVGVEVRDACVALHRSSVWGFQHGVHASGRRAVAELQDCTVAASLCGVSALMRASVTLRNTSVQIVDVPVRMDFWDDQLSPCAVTARPWRCVGGGGHVQVERCVLIVEGCGNDGMLASFGGSIAVQGSDVISVGRCVTAEERGTVAALHCTILSEADAACCAEDDGSVIKIVSGRLAGVYVAGQCTGGATLTARDAAITGLSGEAVAMGAHHGAVLRMSECTISDVGHGVLVMRATCVAHNTTISNLQICSRSCGQIGNCQNAYSQEGGRLTVKGGFIRGCRTGVLVSDLGCDYGPTYTELVGVSFDANMVAMHIGRGAVLAVDDCVFTGGWSPCKLESGNAPTNTDRDGLVGEYKTSWVDEHGVPRGQTPWRQQAGEGWKDLGELRETALCITDDAGPATITGCTFQNNLQDVRYHGRQGLRVSDCTFAGQAQGCCVSLQGRASVRDCTFSTTACALDVRAHGCGVTGCWIDETVEQGVLVDGGAAATIARCTIEAHQIAIEATDHSMVAVMDCQCLGPRAGITVAWNSEVMAERFVISGCAVAVQVAAGGGEKSKVKLIDSTLSGASKVGLLLSGVGACGKLEGCKIRECEVGVLVKPGALARVCSTIMSQCEVGVVIGVPVKAPAHAYAAGPQPGTAAAAPAAQQPRLDAHEGMLGAPASPRAAASLRTVDIVGCRRGVQVHETGRVDVERVYVEVRRAAAAFTATRIGPASRFQQCRAVGDSAPAVTARQLLLSGSGLPCKVDDITGIAVEDDGASVEG